MNSISKPKRVSFCLLNNPQIEFSFPFGVKPCSCFDLRSSVLEKLNEIYPGINMIHLFLSKEDYAFCFVSSYPSEEYLSFTNKTIRFNEETLDKLFSCIIYIKITNLYGIEDISKIEEIECTFISPQNAEFLKNILIPNNFINLEIFNDVCNQLFNSKNYKLDKTQFPNAIIQASDLKNSTIKLSFLDSSLNNILKTIQNNQINNCLLDSFFSQYNISIISPILKNFFSKDIYSLGHNKLYCGFNSSFYSVDLTNLNDIINSSFQAVQDVEKLLLLLNMGKNIQLYI